MKGYWDLRERAAWIDLSGRARLRVAGEDRKRLLHAMTTQHIEGLAPGESVYAFFLNAQGRVLADAWILCREEDLLLDLEPEVRQKIAAHLDKYIIADDVTVEDLTDTTACIGVVGGQEEDLPYGLRGRKVILSRRERDAFVASLGLPEADAEAVRTVRLEHGVPRYGDDITESHIAQETGQLQALHFSKGCYLGQEIVERVRSRGILHKKLMPLRIEATEVPAPQSEILSGGEKAGILYSAAWSPAEKCVRALGLMRLDFVEQGRPLDVGGARVSIVASS